MTAIRHRDFERIYNEFIRYYKTQAKGESEYYSWLRSLSLDETREYGAARESFQWAKDNIRFWKEDTDNKYYKILVGFPITSMNGNVYRENDLIASTKALIGLHPSLNHKDEFWFSPDNPENRWGTLTVVGAEYEDGASETVLKVPKSAVCPICNGAKMTELIDNKRIVNVSLEGSCMMLDNEGCKGFHYNEKGFTLLTTDVLPGIPMARIFPMESYVPLSQSPTVKIGDKKRKIRVIGLSKPKENLEEFAKKAIDKGFLKVGEPCSAELKACVDALIADGKPEDSAYAICKAKIGEATADPNAPNKQREPPLPQPDDKMQCPEGTRWSGEQGGCVPIEQPLPEKTHFPEGTEVALGTPAASDTSHEPIIDSLHGLTSEKVARLKAEDRARHAELSLEEWQNRFKTLNDQDLELKGKYAESLKTVDRLEKHTTELNKTKSTDEAKIMDLQRQLEKNESDHKHKIEEMQRQLEKNESDHKQKIEEMNSDFKHRINTVEKSRNEYKTDLEALKQNNEVLLEKYKKMLDANLELSKKLTENNEDYVKISKEKEDATEKLKKAKRLGKITMKL